MQFFVWLSFQRNSCYRITKHYKICYFGKLQHFRFNAGKVMVYSNLMTFVWELTTRPHYPRFHVLARIQKPITSRQMSI